MSSKKTKKTKSISRRMRQEVIRKEKALKARVAKDARIACRNGTPITPLPTGKITIVEAKEPKRELHVVNIKINFKSVIEQRRRGGY